MYFILFYLKGRISQKILQSAKCNFPVFWFDEKGKGKKIYFIFQNKQLTESVRSRAGLPRESNNEHMIKGNI